MRALWPIPVMVLLAGGLLFINDGFYIAQVNYDPSGDVQQWEWRYNQEVMTKTSGYLCGHLLALIAGMWLARRHRYPVALAGAAAIGAALAGTAFLTARLLGSERMRVTPSGEVLWEPAVIGDVPYGPLLLAFPLYAMIGAGLVVVLAHRPRTRGARITGAVVLLIGWWLVTIAGQLTDDGLDKPFWTLVLIPPLAASTAIGMASLSLDAWEGSLTVEGDWGVTAANALLIGLTAWTAVITVAAVVSRRGAATDDGIPSRSG